MANLGTLSKLEVGKLLHEFIDSACSARVCGGTWCVCLGGGQANAVDIPG